MCRRREDELPFGVDEMIEQIEQLLLGPFLAREQLDVVEQQRGRAPIARSPPIHAIAVDRGDQLVHERLSR
jgi:hypothetical protein